MTLLGIETLAQCLSTKQVETRPGGNRPCARVKGASGKWAVWSVSNTYELNCFDDTTNMSEAFIKTQRHHHVESLIAR
jgi:hypothetical protein